VLPLSLAYTFVYQASYGDVVTLDRRLLECAVFAGYLGVLGIIAAFIASVIASEHDGLGRLVLASCIGFVIGMMPFTLVLYMLPMVPALIFGLALYTLGPCAFLGAFLMERRRRTRVGKRIE
jgi:hypothetical protein